MPLAAAGLVGLGESDYVTTVFGAGAAVVDTSVGVSRGAGTAELGMVVVTGTGSVVGGAVCGASVVGAGVATVVGAWVATVVGACVIAGGGGTETDTEADAATCGGASITAEADGTTVATGGGCEGGGDTTWGSLSGDEPAAPAWGEPRVSLSVRFQGLPSTV